MKKTYPVVSVKGVALYEQTPHAALKNLNFKLSEIGLYSELRMRANCGEQVVNWFGGEREFLPRMKGHIFIKRLADEERVSRRFVDRTIAKLERHGFIRVIKRSRRLGLIFTVEELEKIPAVKNSIRLVKPNSKTASSVWNDIEKILDHKEEWTSAGISLSKLSASKPIELKEFFEFLRGESAHKFAHPCLTDGITATPSKGVGCKPSSELSTQEKTETSPQGVKGPTGVDPVLSAAVAALPPVGGVENAALNAPLISVQDDRSHTRSALEASAQSIEATKPNARASNAVGLAGRVEFSQRVIDRLFDLGFAAKFKAKQTVADISLAIEESEKEVLNWSGFDFIRDSARLDSFFLTALGLIMYKKSSS